MKIATWNINSVRARVERLITWLKTAQPDVLFLQELKCTDEQFPRDEVKAAGYFSETFGQKTYNGVAILSRAPVSDVVRGMKDGVDDDHARLIWCTFGGIRMCGLYAPNGQAVGSPAYQYKLEWYERLTRYLGQHEGDLLLCGDFNVAPEDLDVWDPRYFADKTLFTLPEREAFKKLRETLHLTDAYRLKHPNEPGKFSWWDYRLLAFPKNAGLRIDHFLLSSGLVPRCAKAEIDRDARKGKQPSDHAPVWVELL